VEETLIVGNTLRETAYHEAGHIVVATALGLDLRPNGITIWEAAQDVMDGLAGYWDDEADWEKNLQAVRAGQIAQWREFPQSHTAGAKPDNDYFFKAVREYFAGSIASNMWENVSKKANTLLEAHWGAVVEIAETLIAPECEWMSVGENEHPLAKRKKRLGGEVLVAILSSHRISARVRAVGL
jgi:hypothetical protein